MAKKSSGRLNDTSAVAAIPAFTPERNESQNSSVRKIDNGYITSTSSCRDGRYESSESFSESPPMAVERNPMERAISYMKREGSI